MFGDDLKKSLEPIQVSEELLKKTRKSIEAARLEQAKTSLEKASKKSFSSGKYVRIGAMAACAILVGIGLWAVLPALGRKSTEKADAVAYDTTKALDRNMVAEVDSLMPTRLETTQLATTTMENECIESEDSYDDDDENTFPEAEETAADETVPSKRSNYFFAPTALINGKTLSINSQGNALTWGSDTNSTLPALPALDSNNRIEGISFIAQSNLLCVVTSADAGSDLAYGTCTAYIYSLKDNTWKKEFVVSQYGELIKAVANDNNLLLMTKYQVTDPDAGSSIPALKADDGNWEPLDSYIYYENHKPGGTYYLTITSDLVNNQVVNVSITYK